ncbi:MAG: hypothetical protein JO040_03450 [Gemmatimonadetes bacterium]|nr:hypothetical protein [Gemmatimonadota bacterium]
MKKIQRVLLVLVLLALPLPLHAQQGRGRKPEHRPFALLLDHRQELGLSADQVARLQAIARRLEERNQPLREQLRRQREAYFAARRAQIARLSPEARRDTLRRLQGERGKPHPIPAEMRPIVEQMRAHTHDAMEDAETVLTSEQKERARALYRAHREELRRQKGERAGAGGRVAGSRAGS